MNSITTFSIGLGLTMTITLLALIYLQPHMKSILTELCGTEERARFWISFSNVTLFLTPAIFALRNQPENGSAAALVYQMSDQISSALVGLVLAIGIVGIVIGRFISRERMNAALHGQADGAEQSKPGKI
jgi:hypothetical protein